MPNPRRRATSVLPQRDGIAHEATRDTARFITAALEGLQHLMMTNLRIKSRSDTIVAA